MARIRFDVQVSGVLSNATAAEFEAGAKRFQDACVEAGLEVRGKGLDVELDEEPSAVDEPPASAPAAATPEPTV